MSSEKLEEQLKRVRKDADNLNNALSGRYEEIIKELLVPATRITRYCEKGSRIDFDNRHDRTEARRYRQVVEKAKELLGE